MERKKAIKIKLGHIWYSTCPDCGKQHGSAMDKTLIPDYVYCDCK